MSDPIQDIVTQLRRGCDRNDRQDYDRFYDLAEEAADEIARLRETIRAIELAVDGLITKAFTQRPETQAALDRIKARCREALNAKRANERLRLRAALEEIKQATIEGRVCDDVARNCIKDQFALESATDISAMCELISYLQKQAATESKK